MIAALFVLPVARLIMGPIAGLDFAHFGIVVGMTLLGAFAFSAFGLLLGTAIAGEQIGLMFGLIVAPMIFFGCAYYPWKALAAAPVVQVPGAGQSAGLRLGGYARRAHAGAARIWPRHGGRGAGAHQRRSSGAGAQDVRQAGRVLGMSIGTQAETALRKAPSWNCDLADSRCSPAA